MKPRLTAIFAILFCYAISEAQERTPLAQTLVDLDPEVVFTSDADPSAYVVRDSRTGVKPTESSVITDEQGRPVYDINVQTGDRSQYTVAAQFYTTAPVKKGDVCLARITMRTLFAHQETAECAIYFMFQQSTSPWTKSINTQLSCGPEWTTYDLPFVAAIDYPAGKETAIELALGSLAQHIQVTGMEVLNFKDKVAVGELPQTRFTYFGREEGAQWRNEALARIEEIRTAPINVKVKDSKGRPVKGAEVKVQMQKADFIWGTAVKESALASDDSLSLIYKDVLKRYFNTAIIENGFKGGGWYWEDSRKCNTLVAFEWLKANGFRQRGHNLVWPGWKFNPRATRVIAQQGDKERFDRFIKAQFHERMAYTRGELIAWDVVNEIMHEKDFFPYLPEDVVVDWFKLAKELDPDAQLFINEYAMLNGAHSPVNIKEYIEKIVDLRSKGAPIEAVGIQGHVGTQPRSPMQVITDLDLFIPLGLPIQITEFDINTTDEELQADYTRDFLIAVYSHPLITGVNLWGFHQKHHWKPNAAMYRADWTAKPNAAVWEELVIGDWKTKYTEKTDRTGLSSERGHFGEYILEVTYKGQTRTLEFHLDNNGYNCEIQF